MKDTLIEHVHNTHSTNGLLSSMLQGESASERKIPPFFALWADFQSAGRGMGSNRWFSEEGKNLLVSFYFEPGIPASRQFLFNQYFSVATCRFMAQRVSDVAIKWPNDIYVGGKKIAGILIEHVIQGDKLKHTIAGIGINLNQDRFPSEIPNPTSLWMETGKHYDVEEFLHQYQQFLRAQYTQLSVSPDAVNTLQEAYLGSLYKLGIHGRYRIHGRETVATILGVDDFGRLQLRDENGTDYVCVTKEVVFL